MNKKQMAKYGDKFIFCIGKYKTTKLKYFRGGVEISKEDYRNLEKKSYWIAEYWWAMNGAARVWINKIHN